MSEKRCYGHNACVHRGDNNSYGHRKCLQEVTESRTDSLQDAQSLHSASITSFFTILQFGGRSYRAGVGRRYMHSVWNYDNIRIFNIHMRIKHTSSIICIIARTDEYSMHMHMHTHTYQAGSLAARGDLHDAPEQLMYQVPGKLFKKGVIHH